MPVTPKHDATAAATDLWHAEQSRRERGMPSLSIDEMEARICGPCPSYVAWIEQMRKALREEAREIRLWADKLMAASQPDGANGLRKHAAELEKLADGPEGV